MADPNPDDSRQQGVELGALAGRLDAHSYPTTAEELLEAYGDAEIVLEDGSQSLEDVLGKSPEASFPSAEAVRTAVVGLVDDEAIGRKHYSDRDPPVDGEQTEHRPESL